jgi:hypothetical protein
MITDLNPVHRYHQARHHNIRFQRPKIYSKNKSWKACPKCRANAALLLKKKKTGLDISWKAKGELKYKGNIARGRNVVDLVNDVLR